MPHTTDILTVLGLIISVRSLIIGKMSLYVGVLSIILALKSEQEKWACCWHSGSPFVEASPPALTVSNPRQPLVSACIIIYNITIAV